MTDPTPELDPDKLAAMVPRHAGDEPTERAPEPTPDPAWPAPPAGGRDPNGPSVELDSDALARDVPRQH